MDDGETCQPEMEGKGWPFGSRVFGVFLLCICYFPMLCPGSGVVLDCIDF